MARKVRFIDKDRGWDRLKREVESARRKPHVQVGVFGEEAARDHGGLANIEVAATHEFGMTLNHPGGTPYFIGEDGRAKFVSKAEGAGLPVTQPHKIVIPERSFIRGTIDQKVKAIVTLSRNLQIEVFKGRMTTKKALGMLGVFIQGAIRERMSKGIPPPLKAATIRRKTVDGKAGTTPLIDTGQLRGSIDFKVNNA